MCILQVQRLHIILLIDILPSARQGGVNWVEHLGTKQLLRGDLHNMYSATTTLKVTYWLYSVTVEVLRSQVLLPYYLTGDELLIVIN